MEKLKAGICDGPQVRAVMKGLILRHTLSASELSA